MFRKLYEILHMSLHMLIPLFIRKQSSGNLVSLLPPLHSKQYVMHGLISLKLWEIENSAAHKATSSLWEWEID